MKEEGILEVLYYKENAGSKMPHNFYWPTAGFVRNDSREKVHISNKTRRRSTSVNSDQGMNLRQPLDIELGKSLESSLHNRHRRKLYSSGITYSSEVKPRASSMRDNEVFQQSCGSYRTSSRQQIYGQTPERKIRSSSFDTRSEAVRSPTHSMDQSPCKSDCSDRNDAMNSPTRSMSLCNSESIRKEYKVKLPRGSMSPCMARNAAFNVESRNTSPIFNFTPEFYKRSNNIPIIRISNYDADMLRIAQARRFDEPIEDPMAIRPASNSPPPNQWSDEDEEDENHETVRCITPRLWLRFIRIFLSRLNKKMDSNKEYHLK